MNNEIVLENTKNGSENWKIWLCHSLPKSILILYTKTCPLVVEDRLQIVSILFWHKFHMQISKNCCIVFFWQELGKNQQMSHEIFCWWKIKKFMIALQCKADQWIRVIFQHNPWRIMETIYIKNQLGTAKI